VIIKAYLIKKVIVGSMHIMDLSAISRRNKGEIEEVDEISRQAKILEVQLEN